MIDFNKVYEINSFTYTDFLNTVTPKISLKDLNENIYYNLLEIKEGTRNVILRVLSEEDYNKYQNYFFLITSDGVLYLSEIQESLV